MCRSLLDVSLALTSVAAIGAVKGGTRSNLEGPYHAKHPLRADGNLIEKPVPAAFPRLTLTGTLRDLRGKPIAGATLDFWQADSAGIYDRKGTHLRGMVKTDSQGRYVVHTVLPHDYSEHDHDPIGELFRAMGKPNTRAAHIHLKVNVDGEERLTTQIFMPNSAFLRKDYVEGAVSDDLIVKLEPQPMGPGATPAYRANFDIVLGERARGAAA